MSYCDPDKLFAQMPAFNANKATYTTAMTISIEEAESIIDATLGVRFTVPFPAYNALANPNPCPKIITTISSLLSRAIFLSGCYLVDASNAEPKMSKLLYDRAEELMKKLVDGSMTIVDQPGNPNVTKNLGVYSGTRNKIPNLKNFDLESRLQPRLHAQMRSGDPLVAKDSDGLPYDSDLTLYEEL